MMKSQQCVFYIGDVAKKTGVGVETIRYYERVGVVSPPARGRNGYRLYEPAQIERLVFIKRCRELGFSLDHATSLLRLSDAQGRTCRQVRTVAEQRLAEVREKIADLQRMETVLQGYVSACPGDTSNDCPIVTALSQGRAV